MFTFEEIFRAAPAAFRTSGTAWIVLTFGVTSSPVVPSPRVAARTRTPLSYTSETDRPSIFSSQTKRRRPAEAVLHALQPRLQLLAVVGVVEREQRDLVPHVRQVGDGRARPRAASASPA